MTDCTNFDRYRPVMDTISELTKDTMAPLKMQSEPAMGSRNTMPRIQTTWIRTPEWCLSVSARGLNR